jgi:hypothetical protein
MSRWLTRAILMTGFSLTMSTGAYAQLKDNIEIQLFWGGSWHSSNRYVIGFPQVQQPTPPIQNIFKLDAPAWRGGVRVGVFTRGHWGQEFFYSYEPNTAHFEELSPNPNSVDLAVAIHNYGITGLYYFQESEERRVRPYASFGLGGTLYRLTSNSAAFVRDPNSTTRLDIGPDMDNAHEIGMHYGLGLKTTRAAGWLGFRFDVRGYLGRHPSFGLPRQSDDSTQTVFPATGAIHNGEVSAGLIFYFGRR